MNGSVKVPVGEALRYMGAANADGATRRLAEETAKMLEERLQPRFVWRACRVDRSGEGVILPEAGMTLPGTLAAKMLAECGTAVLLACTLGAGFDRMLPADCPKSRSLRPSCCSFTVLCTIMTYRVKMAKDITGSFGKSRRDSEMNAGPAYG